MGQRENVLMILMQLQPVRSRSRICPTLLPLKLIVGPLRLYYQHPKECVKTLEAGFLNIHHAFPT